jgi:riboflavin biosynthesis pyrimidine reductase
MSCCRRVRIAQQALAAGLVDEIILHVMPKLIGRGIRLSTPLRWSLMRREARIPLPAKLVARRSATREGR